ncbi:hypothetical protein FB446DRAFT_706842 [Lentinula raphanica]|nr:hypothetical protein FB446DRAFT_706842 [Lentinula raphanica]
MDVLAMPVDGGPSTNNNLATPIARPVKNSQALNLYFQILHEDLGTTRPHFALWMTSSICLSVLKDKPNEDKPNVVKREDKVVKEHNKLKFKSYQMGKPLETHTLLGSRVYWLGTFYFATGSKETLLTQLESLRGDDEISLFLTAWTFASTASHPDPVIFHPAAHNPSRLPLIFLSAMTRPDDFPVHYGLPAESWRAVAAETPLQTQERMKPPKEEALKNFNSKERVKLTSTSNTATPNESERKPPAIVHETWNVPPPY